VVRVIETNLSLNDTGEIVDHQSRVIEVESWETFINEIQEAKTVIRPSVIGNLHGTSIPIQSNVEDIMYDDFHLSCNIYNHRGIKTKKLACLVR
jgi:hypothetical protein